MAGSTTPSTTAAAAAVGPVASGNETGWRKTMDGYLTSAFLCLRHQIPLMLEKGAGVIVNNASVDGLRGYPFPGGAAYSAAKHGVIGLTRSAALENAKAGLRISAICPGWVDTPAVARYLKDPATESRDPAPDAARQDRFAGGDRLERPVALLRRRRGHDRQPADRRRRLHGVTAPCSGTARIQRAHDLERLEASRSGRGDSEPEVPADPLREAAAHDLLEVFALEPGQLLGEERHALAIGAGHAGDVGAPEEPVRPEGIEQAMQRIVRLRNGYGCVE